ncbi:MAG TPA: GNAT family N-acetyltransferase [Anaerolineae bacterium]|nr:GNAT family N-acetyltransferase [Anaerolineae bacterium]
MATNLLEAPAQILDGRFSARPATLDDVEAAVAMFNAYARSLLGIDQFTAEGYRNEWQVPGLNLETDVQVVTTLDGQIVGCTEVWDVADPHVRINVWGRVHPDYQGRGIGSAMLGWAEERARQAIPKAPEGARVTMFSRAISVDAGADPLLRQAGFELIRHSYLMAIDLEAPPPAPAWPEGIALRTLVVGQDERATVQAVRDAFRDHWGHVERPFEDDLQHWLHFIQNDGTFDPTLWFLAMDGDQIAGVSLCWLRSQEDPQLSWVGTLGVLRPWRRQGLGLALLLHSFGEFYRRSQRKVGLGVDASSLTGATRLYERAGMRVERLYNTYEKELRPGIELSTQSIT